MVHKPTNHIMAVKVSITTVLEFLLTSVEKNFFSKYLLSVVNLHLIFILKMFLKLIVNG